MRYKKRSVTIKDMLYIGLFALFVFIAYNGHYFTAYITFKNFFDHSALLPYYLKLIKIIAGTVFLILSVKIIQQKLLHYSRPLKLMTGFIITLFLFSYGYNSIYPVIMDLPYVIQNRYKITQLSLSDPQTFYRQAPQHTIIYVGNTQLELNKYQFYKITEENAETVQIRYLPYTKLVLY